MNISDIFVHMQIILLVDPEKAGFTGSLLTIGQQKIPLAWTVALLSYPHWWSEPMPALSLNTFHHRSLETSSNPYILRRTCRWKSARPWWKWWKRLPVRKVQLQYWPGLPASWWDTILRGVFWWSWRVESAAPRQKRLPDKKPAQRLERKDRDSTKPKACNNEDLDYKRNCKSWWRLSNVKDTC